MSAYLFQRGSPSGDNIDPRFALPETVMIDPHLFLGFVAAVAVLMLIPGPNVALIVANSVAHGPRYGLLTVGGTASAMVVQLALTSLGMAGMLHAMGMWFEWVRWIGAAYLLYLGIAQWRAKPVDLAATRPEPKSRRAIFLRAVLVALTNPKTLFFYGAFFPQFVSPAHDPVPQLGILCATFLVVALVIDSGWALLAARARFVLARHGRLRNQVSGTLLIGAGASLAALRTS
jgi:threonine/homoserine/homoserine lactone efflux protein